MTRIIDDEPKRPERSEELQAAIRAIVEEVHDLLDGPDGDGQWTGEMEMQRVVLTIPRAFVRLAAFLATVDESAESPLGFWDYVETTPEDTRAVRRLNRRRKFLS